MSSAFVGGLTFGSPTKRTKRREIAT